MDPSTWRPDQWLLAMLDELGDWVVNDADGLITGEVLPTLREALGAGVVFRQG